MAGPKNFPRTRRERERKREKKGIQFRNRRETVSTLAVLIASVNKLYQPGRGQLPPSLVNKNARPAGGGSWKNDVERTNPNTRVACARWIVAGDKRVSSLRKKPWAQPFPIRKFDGPTGVSATNYACADTRCLLTENADGLGTRARFALKLSGGVGLPETKGEQFVSQTA